MQGVNCTVYDIELRISHLVVRAYEKQYTEKRFGIKHHSNKALKGLKGGHFDPPQVFLDNSETGGDFSTKC